MTVTPVAITGLLLIHLLFKGIKGPVLLHKGTGLIEFLKAAESFPFELVVQISSVMRSFSQPASFLVKF